MNGKNFFSLGRRRVASRVLVCGLLMLFVPTHAQQAWNGPTDGPPGQRNKRITFISYDFRNSGITGAYRGLFTAAKELGWQLQAVDGRGNLDVIRTAFARAVKNVATASSSGALKSRRCQARFSWPNSPVSYWLVGTRPPIRGRIRHCSPLSAVIRTTGRGWPPTLLLLVRKGKSASLFSATTGLPSPTQRLRVWLKLSVNVADARYWRSRIS